MWKQSRIRRCGPVFAAAVLLMAYPSRAHARETCAVRAPAQGEATELLQAAIDRCAAAGGGTVRLLPGVYTSGPLAWKSHVRIDLSRGATLLGSPQQSEYPVRQDAPWRRVALLHADGAQDIALTGAGVVDGNGAVWWGAKAADRKAGRPEAPRPLLIDLVHTDGIRIEGVTLQNSPMYNIAAFLCRHLTVRNVRIVNPARTAPNTDGIDPVSTSDVLIEHTTIDTGDDNVAIKSGLVERGDPDVASSDIRIRNCTFLHGHGLSIGSETAGGVHNVQVEHVRFDGTRQGIRIKSARGRGNDIGDFRFRDITMTGVETPIQITAWYTGHSAGDTPQPMAEHTPRFHDIDIENVTAIGAKAAMQVEGLPESPVKGLVLQQVRIDAETGAVLRYAQIKTEHLDISTKKGPALLPGPGVTVNGKKLSPPAL